jgi:hypothetical protein
MFVSYALIPYHKGSILAKLAPIFFKERSNQGYFIVGEVPHKKNLKSIVEASMLPFSLLLSISILIMTDVIHAFPLLANTPPFTLPWMILLASSVFINFALFIILPLLALFTSSIWILEGSGLRYYDPDKKIIVEVVEDYKLAVGSISGVGAVISFLSLLYDIMISRGLGFDYVLSYLSFTVLLLYPSTLLVTALYIHFSENQSIEKVLRKMKNSGFSLPEISSIDLK